MASARLRGSWMIRRRSAHLTDPLDPLDQPSAYCDQPGALQEREHPFGSLRLLVCRHEQTNVVFDLGNVSDDVIKALCQDGVRWFVNHVAVSGLLSGSCLGGIAG